MRLVYVLNMSSSLNKDIIKSTQLSDKFAKIIR